MSPEERAGEDIDNVRYVDKEGHPVIPWWVKEASSDGEVVTDDDLEVRPSKRVRRARRRHIPKSNLLLPEVRRSLLDEQIANAIRGGWRLQTRTDYTAQLVKNKGANCLITLILLCFIIVPGILYMILYKGEEGLYLEVDEIGQVHETRRG